MIYALLVLSGAAVLGLGAATLPNAFAGALVGAPTEAALGALVLRVGLGWSSASFALVGLGYLARTLEWPVRSVALLGKDARGRRAPWAWLLGGPFIGFLRLVRVLQSLTRTERAWDLVAPGVYVGRRVSRHELPHDVALVVDLAAELEPGAGLLAAAGTTPARSGETSARVAPEMDSSGAVAAIDARPIDYVSLPGLDGLAPRAEALRALVDRLAEDGRPLYFHCAAGHGRSATAAAALLIRRGAASGPADAIALMRRARPKVKLGSVQARAAWSAGERRDADAAPRAGET